MLVHEAFVVARPTLLTKTWLGLWFSGLRGYRDPGLRVVLVQGVSAGVLEIEGSRV